MAQRLRVHRETIDEWAKRSRARGPQRVATCWLDRTRTGRPRQLAETMARGVVAVIDTEPHARGYRAAPWTAPWLRQYVREEQALAVSAGTVRRCLHRSKTALEGERKQVTVLFADLKGSMELLADRAHEGSAQPLTTSSSA